MDLEAFPYDRLGKSPQGRDSPLKNHAKKEYPGTVGKNMHTRV